MPRIVAHEDIKRQAATRRRSLHTPFLAYRIDSPELPVAFLSEAEPGMYHKPHFHHNDEFIVVVGGGGTLGRMELTPYTVFFANAYTPYGPLVGDDKTGLGIFVLFPHFDPGAQEGLDYLKQVPDRRPFQAKRKVEFSPVNGNGNAVALSEIPGMKNEEGLFVCTLTMAPGSRTVAPDPSSGNGQYLLIVKGSMIHQNRECKAYTVVFVEPQEGPLQLQAGAEGLHAIIMNYPRSRVRSTAKAAPSATAGYKKWQCELCDFAYDEALGLPDEGIPAGTRWADVPDTWTCPDCAASKSDFRMREVG
jgi:rubredoxin